MNRKKRVRQIVTVAAILYCLAYVGLRTSHVVVHRWYEIIKPSSSAGKHGSDYWIMNDVGHGSFLDPTTLKPRVDRWDRILRTVFAPFVQSETLFWTARERIRFGGGLWFYTTAQRQELRRVLRGEYGHNLRDGIYTFNGINYRLEGTQWQANHTSDVIVASRAETSK